MRKRLTAVTSFHAKYRGRRCVFALQSKHLLLIHSDLLDVRAFTVKANQWLIHCSQK